VPRRTPNDLAIGSSGLDHRDVSVFRLSVVFLVAICACADDPPPAVFVHGLAGHGLVLENGAGERIGVRLNGPAGFPTAATADAPYEITVVAQPAEPAQVCAVTSPATDGELARVECETPGIREFSASRRVVSSGDELALLWSTRQASSCSLDPVGVDPADTEFGTTAIRIDADASFDFRCDVAGESAIRSVDVLVTDSDWVQLSTGGAFGCGLKTDGRLFCWGADGGLEPVEDVLWPYRLPTEEPSHATDWARLSTGVGLCAVKVDGRLFCFTETGMQQVGTDSDWASIAVGGTATYAIKTDGRMFEWGWNGWGQMGYPPANNDETITVPIQEPTLANDWASVAAGDLHVCALKTDGRIFCWGRNGYGQGGNGTSAQQITATQEVTAAADWIAITAGRDHTCALKSDGRLFCWGSGEFGQVGNGVHEVINVAPTQEASAATDWVSVSAGGGDYTCAVKEDGRLFCWGHADYGTLGNSSNVQRDAPVQETTFATDWAVVSAAPFQHACGLKRDGRIFCWGRGRDYLGAETSWMQWTPAQEVTQRADWSAVSTSAVRSCAITAEHALYCWGGELGGLAGDLQPWSEIAPLAPTEELTSSRDWAQVSTGGGHTCAIKLDGTLFCWGLNDDGQLGDGTVTSTLEPVQEMTLATDWASVSSGLHYTCATKVDGRLFCWGVNEVGQLGRGNTEPSLVPVQEQTGATNWAQIAAGMQHTCATRMDGSLYCWGLGANGRVDGDGWAQVSVGDDHTCAVKIDGRLYCWGGNAAGQLGDGTREDRGGPTQEGSGAINWAQVSAGAFHTCGVRMDGTLYCWGRGDVGQLGAGNVLESVLPVQESDGASTWIAVAASRGYYQPHTCGLREGGRIFCWGNDDLGQVGRGAPPAPIWPAQ
jgi:alpha-tubulin suppressor-like RCC1 family protein